ncbi:hypothetical protein RRF57_006505 [Xylaria bambusicola]|uniref:Uncharacterized protein n=1 Tax=Xylaria bambusicola TaxID=326684 RepID=A0AAN7UEI1_9PEZI
MQNLSTKLRAEQIAGPRATPMLLDRRLADVGAATGPVEEAYGQARQEGCDTLLSVVIRLARDLGGRR